VKDTVKAIAQGRPADAVYSRQCHAMSAFGSLPVAAMPQEQKPAPRFAVMRFRCTIAPTRPAFNGRYGKGRI
jgi:hypothetical protein